MRIVMLTASDEDQSLFEALKGGAQGYLLKKIEPQALFTGRAEGGGPGGAIPLEEHGDEPGRRAHPSRPPGWGQVGADGRLSPREREVLELVAKGKSNKEIGLALVITENTVKNHLKNILEKLHLENRVQAAIFALREGLLEQPPPRSA